MIPLGKTAVQAVHGSDIEMWGAVRLVSDVSVEELKDEAAIGQASNDSLYTNASRIDQTQPRIGTFTRFIAGKNKTLDLY